MKITRIDNTRDIDKQVGKIELKIGANRFTIREEFGELKIHAHTGSVTVRPCCANEINIVGNDA